MARRLIKFFFLCFAFLLTLKSHAEGDAFNKAQQFFSESQKATKNYLKSGKGLEDFKNQPQYAERNPTYKIPDQTFSSNNQYSVQPNKATKTKAVFFSLMSQTINDNNFDSPNYGVSVAVSIPVYSSLSYLNSEFQFSGDVRNASEWGQVQFLQKEAFSVYRNRLTLVEFFMGMGFGFGHGSQIISSQRFYAPWAAGFQWGRNNTQDPAFYRFELGWGGDFYFLDNNYSQGLLVNVSLGYKL